MSAAAEQLNPRFVAYCRAVGIAPTVEALRERDGNWAAFSGWINARLAEWQASQGITRLPLGRDECDAFTAFCEAAADRAARSGAAS